MSEYSKNWIIKTEVIPRIEFKKLPKTYDGSSITITINEEPNSCYSWLINLFKYLK